MFWMILRLLFGTLKVLQEVLAEVPGNPELTELLTSLARALGGNEGVKNLVSLESKSF